MSLSGKSLIDPRQDYFLIADRLGVTRNDRLSQSLTEQLRISPESVVVDVGCGTAGDLGIIAQRTGARVIGVDLSLAMLTHAKPPAVLILADALSIPLQDSCADAAFSVNVIQLVPERYKMFAEVARILRDGGMFALPVTTRHQLRGRFLNRFFPQLLAIERIRYPTVKTLSAELKASGFFSVRCRRIDLGTFAVDEKYLERQRTGIISGLSFIPEVARERGLRRLEQFIAALQAQGRKHHVRWLRTLLVARKEPGDQ